MPPHRVLHDIEVARSDNLILDPGDAGAIPVDRSGMCALVTGGAETRTLAAPTSIGREIVLYLKTDGGNCVITCATTVNSAGNTTITFDTVREALRLIAVESDSTLVWVVTGGDAALT